MARSTALLTALNKAVTAATKAGTLSDLDLPTVELARALARQLDTKDAYMRELARDAHERGAPPPQDDRVTPQTYARVLAQLGFTPASRLEKAKGGKREGTSRTGALGKLRAVSGDD